MSAAPGILLVGRTSFLARHVLAALGPEPVRAVPHQAIGEPDLLDGIGCVVSFARHPDIARDDYDLERDDPDLRLARAIGDRPIRHVMLSTRKVYAPAERPLREDAPLGPVDAYGRHKAALEERLQGMLGERLVVLRLANIFGFEREAGRRTFLAVLLGTLRAEGLIRFDMSPFVERDFLPVEQTARIIAAVAAAPDAPAVLNVGSGIALPTGKLALWIIEGYGSGRLVIEQPRHFDPFVLDVTRLCQRFGRPCTVEDLRARCLALGRELAAPA